MTNVVRLGDHAADYAARQLWRDRMLAGLPEELRDAVSRHAVGADDGAPVPHDISAEEAVVAAVLLDDEAVLRAMGERLEPADFWDERLGACYEAAITLHERGDEVTIPTIAFELQSMGWLDREGLNEVFLVELAGKYFTSVGVEAHARIVRNTAAARTLMGLAEQVRAIAKLVPARLPMVLGYAKEALDRIEAAGPSAGALTAEQLIDRYLKGELSTARPVVPTHLGPLDRALAGGFGIGELVVIAAKTSVGKTALAARIAHEQAIHGVPVGVILVEGRHTKFMHRMAAVRAGISETWAERNGWGPGERDAYEDAFLLQAADHVHFADPVPRTPLAIEQWMRMKARRNGVRHFIVDHIDRVRFDAKMRPDSAYREALQRWGNMANEEEVVVTVLSQVNREVQWHPELRHLREAGAKEELAQVVILLSQGDDAGYSNKNRADHVHTYGSRRWGQRRGIALHVEVAKFTEGEVGYIDSPVGGPAFYVDQVSGAVMVRGE